MNTPEFDDPGPEMLMDHGRMALNLNLVYKVMNMFEEDHVDIESGITSLILAAARAGREGLNMPPKKFLDMCFSLYLMAGEDDLSKFDIPGPIGQA